MDQTSATVDSRRQRIRRRGRVLMIINGVSWILLVVAGRNEVLFDEVWIAIAIFLSIPIAWPVLMPSLGGPTLDDVIFNSFLIGANAVIWGYGFAFLVELLRPPATEEASNGNE